MYLYPVIEFYYTDGVKYLVKELFKREKFLVELARQIFVFPDKDFILIKVYQDNGISFLEYKDKNGKMLQRMKVRNPLPMAPETSFYLYWIGRTLLLPKEF